MVSALDSRVSGPGTNLGRRHCVVVSLLSQCLSPLSCINGNRKIVGENLTKLRGSDLRWTSIPSRGSRNTACRFMQQKSGYEPVLTARLHFFFNAYTYLMFGNYCWIQGMRTLAGLMAFFLVEQEADLFRQ